MAVGPFLVADHLEYNDAGSATIRCFNDQMMMISERGGGRRTENDWVAAESMSTTITVDQGLPEVVESRGVQRPIGDITHRGKKAIGNKSTSPAVSR